MVSKPLLARPRGRAIKPDESVFAIRGHWTARAKGEPVRKDRHVVLFKRDNTAAKNTATTEG
jgi:hypothetical protein